MCIYTFAYVHILRCACAHVTKIFSVEIPQQHKRIRIKTESDACLPGHVHRQHEHKDYPPEF